MVVSEELLSNLITPSAFAVLKNVDKKTVFNNIDSGAIAVVLVGKDKRKYINLDVYKEHRFDVRGRKKLSSHA